MLRAGLRTKMKSKQAKPETPFRKFKRETGDVVWLLIALIVYSIGDWLDLSDKDYHDHL